MCTVGWAWHRAAAAEQWPSWVKYHSNAAGSPGAVTGVDTCAGARGSLGRSAGTEPPCGIRHHTTALVSLQDLAGPHSLLLPCKQKKAAAAE